jgi:hypothetical protein
LVAPPVINHINISHEYQGLLCLENEITENQLNHLKPCTTEEGQTTQRSTEEGQTTQRSTEKGQTTQRSTEEGQTTQWLTEEGQTTQRSTDLSLKCNDLVDG